MATEEMLKELANKTIKYKEIFDVVDFSPRVVGRPKHHIAVLRFCHSTSTVTPGTRI